MLSRREFAQIAAATMGIASLPVGSTRALAQQKMTQADLLDFKSVGNVTLVHVTDIHGQLMPTYFREPSENYGVGADKGQPPHITGKDYLSHFGVKAGSPTAYALTCDGFEGLARTYGKIGGLDRIATVVKAIRAERGDKMVLLDGGDTLQGSWGSLQSKGQDMLDCMALLKPDAMTAHWEFTYGQDRVQEIVKNLAYPFLAMNVHDAQWGDPIFKPQVMLERGGVKIAVLGQAFPFCPIAHPRYMMPDWSFGIHEGEVQKQVDAARKAGAGLVVLLSHNGYDVDKKLASRIKGLDVVLTGHTHDSTPTVQMVGKTLMVASGSSGKFVSRLDLDVQNGEIKSFAYRLIPMFADVIAPDAEMAAKITQVRKPYVEKLNTVLGTTDSLLYRRGNFNGTMDDMICQALLEERDAEIALSPGFRWGTSLLPGQNITFDDLANETAITYPTSYRNTMSGSQLKDVLEDIADNLFNTDPYYQQGGDMVRVGGLGYTIDINQKMGSRISNMEILKTGKAIDPATNYSVAGWASVQKDVKGPAIWDVVSDHLKKHKTVKLAPNRSVKVVGA
ncbi:MAG: thiosulfohydrolase SoxB [Hyphomicrobiales bacterium]|nr:thiosulfohydrolase SoxB [Hyphomicrobiales bacterium]